MLNARAESLRKRTVLYVEDDKEIIEAAKFSLSSSVKSLMIAMSAEEAMELYKSENPDIVITDIALPCMNGIELAKQLKEINESQPVLVVSAHTEGEYLLGSIDAKVDCYITKPVNLSNLKEQLYRAAVKLDENEEMESARNFIKKVMDSSKEMYLVGKDSTITYLNSTFLEYLGYVDLFAFTRDMAADCGITVIEKGISDAEKSFKQWFIEAGNTDGYENLISIIKPGMLKSDAKSWIARVNLLKDTDLFIITFVDVTVMEKQKQFFHNMAMKDPLTEIYNRYKFYEELTKETERSRRYKQTFSVIMFDIDKFKNINDENGHQVGDNVLKELAGVISHNLRNTDIFARYGGEEFIILTPEVDVNGAFKLAEKLNRIIFEHEFEHVGHLTCSFGVSEYKDGLSGDDIVRCADEALYSAKNYGRNRVVQG